MRVTVTKPGRRRRALLLGPLIPSFADSGQANAICVLLSTFDDTAIACSDAVNRDLACRWRSAAWLDCGHAVTTTPLALMRTEVRS